ncbi:MAG: CDP-diacylglycerol--glycerol-3-phosphate 3-phosphatidyltransferase [Candidatus Sumerlaeota bacterium]|nr:CDP-diacylglycerol--glycerol-3-phosphate 3-phosphatidyltransferase [Candidatus Sumerlaeota bacterium]
MNLPNKLTITRMLMVPVIMAFLVFDPRNFGFDLTRPNQDPAHYYSGIMALTWLVALLLFIMAALTDFVDGMIARRLNISSNFGKLMDPLADKLLIAACFVAFVERGIFPAWMVVIILLREFIITGLRSLAFEKGVVIQADRWGKSKTVTQMLTIIVAMILKVLEYFLQWIEHWDKIVRWIALDQYISLLLYSLGVLCVVLSVGSGWLYVRRNWSVIHID